MGGGAVIRSRRGPVVLAVASSAAAVGAAVLFLLAVPALHQRHRVPPPGVAAGLERLGWPASAYSAYWTAVLVAFALVCATVAVLVVWRRPREPMAWLVGLFLVLLGCANSPIMEALATDRPGLVTVAAAANLALAAGLIVLLATFPDGRVVPRSSAPPLVAAVAALVLTGWGSLGEDLSDGWFLLFIVALLGGLAAQIHRYRRVSSWEQRQQTKWVVVAAGIAVLAQVGFPLLTVTPLFSDPGLPALAGELLGVTGVTGGHAVFAVAIGVAVLRHRLWDVDVVVNRTLVYGALTVGVLALYGAAVLGLEKLLRSPDNGVGAWLAAGAVALVLAPTRHRLQQRIDRLMYGHRNEPYRVLSDLGQRLGSTSEPDAVLSTIVRTVAGALRLPYVSLTLRGRQGEEDVIETGTPVAGLLELPLVHQRETVGVLAVAPRSPHEPFNRADRALLDDLARQAAIATVAVRLGNELQRAREQRVLALEEERRRLRRDLHDGLGPALASMTLRAELAHDLLDSDPRHSAELLTELTNELQASTADIRRLVYDLRPPALDDLGLEGALRAFLGNAGTGPQVELVTPSEVPPLSAAVEVAAYRIVQEAVTNVRRHARASLCRVELRLVCDALVIGVDDDGVGLPADIRRGVGLRSMGERAAELGGSCAVMPGPAGGTSIRVQLPHATLDGGPR